MNKKIVDATDCAKEIAQVLEKHGITVSNMDNVLEVAKEMITSSTIVHVE